MNGVHDMGGMHGLGPIAPDPHEPLFHADWEARVLALTLAAGAHGRWNIDASRHARESIPGPDYLRMSYYEKWFTALEGLLVESGLISERERALGIADAEAPRGTPPLTADRVPAVLAAGGPTSRDTPTPERFVAGAAVRARNLHPAGHTRLPRYVRGRVGVVTRDHGAHVFPDSNAHGGGEAPQRLYGVRFMARELWGETAGPEDSVDLDLWDAYLDPA